MTASARHETRALLRAHLAAASSYRHLTRHCPVCHRLQRLALDSAPLDGDAPDGPTERTERTEPVEPSGPAEGPQEQAVAPARSV
ncbi:MULTISPECIES: DUF6274 family protein [Streptomyces]|uniref:DUF6274 family protein n=2 Tax=Streptomyces TaxID=1883 RepID=A0AB39NMH7_9ACTN|nr:MULTISPECIES: DUF6274 family protein [Streptomyces]MCI4142683.1 DUF6274 family protein [Streptomyces sp. MMS20-AI2-20]GGQ05097.1 hypothetical protein GCM10010233_22310 [Streptomyces gancidicus]GGS39517.1 hypothetical protein GCM10010285_18050 [Streptomyces rubiginosus]